MDLQTNPQLELAFDLVRNTNKSIFLTGKAGSGKTTFLHQVKNEGSKRLVVVAPTGVAAINAGGMTIHSFFQLPIGLHLPGVHRREENRKYRFSGQKVRLIRSLDLLVIDEISMVRADLLDAIDEVLRRYRDHSLPFGGVQLLMIGDLHQLPPVVKPEDWDVLSRHYDTPYFFGSLALHKTDYVSIELKHIYRQSDTEFIKLLNKVRDNCLDEESLSRLNSRYIANFRPPSKDGYITLAATNAVAFDINARNLAQLPGAGHVFRAQIDGEFPPSSYPTEETLELKTGAQVMFLKNDMQPEKRYYNGKIGRITTIEEDMICVQCSGDPAEIAVTPSEWQNVKYSLNEVTKEVDELLLGTFTQFPLKLAWAITIHKSQGLTFERAIIDAQSAFAHGQVYVALSRCKSFEGIVLRTSISSSSVKTDPVVKNYTRDAERNAPNEEQIQQAKREYQQFTLTELFSFQFTKHCCDQLCRTFHEHTSSLASTASGQIEALATRAKVELFEVANRFAPQLADYLRQDAMPVGNEPLQVRVRGAAAYFTERIAEILKEATAISIVTENQAVRKAVNSQLRSLEKSFFVKSACFAACGSGFTTEKYQRAKIDADLDFEAKPVVALGTQSQVPNDVPHPALYRKLQQWREQMAEQHGVTVRDVFPHDSIGELVTYLPTNNANLRLIRGIGKARLKRYGKEISDIIRTFCQENQLPSDRMTARDAPRPPTSDTKFCSFEMFRAGKGIEQIAAERSLSRSTIEGHLSHFIGLGQLDVFDVLEREKIVDIQQFVAAKSGAAIAEARSYFGDKYSYGELKLVFSHLQYEQTKRNEVL